MLQLLFEHDNPLLCKLIILVVGIFCMIFGATTHFIITFTAVISRARGAENELDRTLASNLLVECAKIIFASVR